MGLRGPKGRSVYLTMLLGNPGHKTGLRWPDELPTEAEIMARSDPNGPLGWLERASGQNPAARAAKANARHVCASWPRTKGAPNLRKSRGARSAGD
jgi:hypothetical protein